MVSEIYSKVILCTLNSASSTDGLLQQIPREYFDVLIVDEASQAMEASMWIAVPNAPKLILAGDVNQLPPVVMSQEAVKGGLNISLMERAIKKLGEDAYINLTTQYRMNEKIAKWSSNRFYDDSLVADLSVKNHLIMDLPSVNDIPLTSKYKRLLTSFFLRKNIFLFRNLPLKEFLRQNKIQTNILL